MIFALPLEPATLADIAQALSVGVMLCGFWMLLQRRLVNVVRTYAAQAFLLALAAAWQAYVQDERQLLTTAVIILVAKALIVPAVLNRIIVKLDLRRSVATSVGFGRGLVGAMGLVGFSMLLVFPVTTTSGALTRETLAMALSVVFLGFWMIITRNRAISQVIALMALENGVLLAVVGVKGMPLVVEMITAVLVLLTFMVFGIFFFHIRTRFDSLDVRNLERVHIIPWLRSS